MVYVRTVIGCYVRVIWLSKNNVDPAANQDKAKTKLCHSHCSLVYRYNPILSFTYNYTGNSRSARISILILYLSQSTNTTI